MVHFLFPSHPLDPVVPDELFVEQYKALVSRGFSVSLFPESVIREGASLRNIPLAGRVVYRGWMLKRDEYTTLTDAITRAGATPFTTPIQYVAAHHLPGWYPLIADFTPETRIYPVDADMPSELAALGWGAYFVKDYVKSLKTSVGSIIREPSQIVHVLSEMRKYRDEIEGGICIRRVEDFQLETETRYFVIEGRPFAPDLSGNVVEVVSECARRVPNDFVSVDVVLRRDGELRVVEIGDGQVSDLVGWSAEAFAEAWVRVSQ